MPSEAGDEQAPLDPHKSTENLEQAPNSGGLGAEGSCGKGNLDRRASTTNMTGDKDKEKERKKSMRPDQEPFEAWEREEMEKLLGELRGHLGERFPTSNLLTCDHPTNISTSHISNTILGRRGHCEQFPVQCRQAYAASDLQLAFFLIRHASIITHPNIASWPFALPTHLSGHPPPIILQRIHCFPLTHSQRTHAGALYHVMYRLFFMLFLTMGRATT